ncbi:MAG: hypothetical protein ACYDHB_13355 [Candidatus Dormibacteria bacterium]
MPEIDLIGRRGLGERPRRGLRAAARTLDGRADRVADPAAGAPRAKARPPQQRSPEPAAPDGQGGTTGVLALHSPGERAADDRSVPLTRQGADLLWGQERRTLP